MKSEITQPNLSRRDFLKLMGIGSLGLAYVISRPILGEKIFEFGLRSRMKVETESLKKLFDSATVEVSENNKIPIEMRGFYTNMVYSYLCKPMVYKPLIAQANDLGARRARVFVGDEFQTTLKETPKSLNQDEKVLDQLSVFAKDLKAVGMGIEIDFFDAYKLGNGQLNTNPVYGKSDISSPFNRSKDFEGYKQFFINPELKKFFETRMKKIIDGLEKREVTNITNWSLINEANPKLIGPGGVKILEKWYREMIIYLRNELNVKKPIVTGLGRPWFMSRELGFTANTVHMYLPLIDAKQLDNYLRDHQDEPVIIQEFGFPYSLRGIKLPKYLYDYLNWYLTKEILRVSTEVAVGDKGKKTIKFKVGAFGGWKIANHRDNYSEENQYISPELKDIISLFNKI